MAPIVQNLDCKHYARDTNSGDRESFQIVCQYNLTGYVSHKYGRKKKCDRRQELLFGTVGSECEESKHVLSHLQKGLRCATHFRQTRLARHNRWRYSL